MRQNYQVIIMLIELHDYYTSQGIHPLNFQCRHFQECSADCDTFTEAKMAYVGSEYEKGTQPRVLFLSLDSGSGEMDPQRRVVEMVRQEEEYNYNEDVVARLPKNRHWDITHKMAWVLLHPFQPDLTIASAKPYWAHTNSAKCCQNNPKRGQAHPRLFRNCRSYVLGELEVLQPEILVTQGTKAKEVIESLPRISFDMMLGYEDEVWVVHIKGRPVLCITTMHPTARDFGKQQMARWKPYVKIAERFITQMYPRFEAQRNEKLR